MEKFCVKGYLKRSGKRVLSILLCVCMIGTMIPITARAETEGTSMPSNGEVTCTCANLCTEDKVNSDCPVCGAEEADLSKCTGKVQSENNVNQLNTGESEEAKNETELTITAWEWIDEEELINPETGILALPFANEETPAFFDDVVALLPTQIQATVVNEEDIEAEAASETITLGDWSCEEYPKEGAYSGSYTFAAALPEGYVLSDEAKVLNVLVELGGAQMYETGVGETAGAFTVTGGILGTDYTYADGVLTIKSDKALTIANTDPSTATTDRIEVADGVFADITLAGVNIDVSSKSDTAAFKIANVSFGSGTITLAGDSVNKLKSGSNCAGLQMIKDLYIKGEGELIATGGSNGAGIGGGDHGEVSNIRIMGGTVIATGGSNGAGIGGNQSFRRLDITITGGTVTATGGSNGAGIGCGNGGDSSSILITGGTVTATGSGGGAGIGGGNAGKGIGIIIKGGTVTATGGSGGGAGIGGGYNYYGTGITISGGTVTATGGSGGAGIGGGNGYYGSGITISGGTVTATGSGGGEGIGGGCNYSGENISITGGTVTATGSGGGAGIGGHNGTGSGITMEGDAVLYTSSINGDYSFNKGVVYDGVTVSGDAGSYTLTDGVGTVYGNPNVSEFTKPAGSKLGTNLADTDYITVTVPDVDYTGAEAVPTATVTVDKTALGGTKTLVQGTDYTVSVSGSDKTNAGAKTATITAVAGSGNVGETTKAFNVNTVDLSADKIEMTLSGIPEAGYVYNSAAKEPVPVVTLKRADGREYTLTKDTDYTVSYSNNTNAYELLSGDEGYEADKAPTVKITAKDGGNFTGSRSMNFKILIADMPGFTITPYSDSYDGADHEVVSITPEDGFSDYTVYYRTDNKATWSTTVPTITDAGTLDFYVKVTKPNYKDWISEKQTAKVTKATPYIATAPTAAAITYGDTLGDSTLNGGTVQYSDSDTTTVSGSFAWKDSSVKPSVSDSGTIAYRVVFNPSDTVNYNTAETDITLTVNKADNAPNMPSSTMNVANSCTKVSDVTIPTDWVWQDADKNTALVVDTPVTATAVYNGADKGNYENETVSVTITRSSCDHIAGDILYTGTDEKAPTCTTDGLGHRECTICHATIESGIVVKAAHKFSSAWTIDVAPTTTSEGSKSHHCIVCGEKNDVTVIPKLVISGGGDSGNAGDSSDNDGDNNDSGNTGNITDLGIGNITKPTIKPIVIPGSFTQEINLSPGIGNNIKPATNTEDNIEEPFIKGENGKEGWDVIRDEVDQVKDGDTVTVDMNGAAVVPSDVLSEIKGKDVTIVFDMGNGITWSVNGQSITGDAIGDIDFSVKTNTNSIPVDIINNITGERYSKQISLSYDGEFGFTAVLSINMEAENAGLFANLFYYNENTGEMEFICYDEIAADGTADLTFTHASDYAIVIDTEPMDSVSDGEVLNGETDSDEEISTIENDKKDTQDVTEADSKTWNPWWVIIICIVVIVITLGAFIVIKKKKSEDLIN
ncbi:MAG: hypothetical protein MR442_00910 [Lachnospiraceae bacterium]|nr:hypothetical protein [Lachnospiraceae bacterium]